ncbi:MAG: UTP--glucose-1-phosphate uridylyltransferase, partial [bacterium]
LLAYEQVLATRLPGKRYDCGSKLGYLEASVELGVRHPEIGEAFATFLRQRRD